MNLWLTNILMTFGISMVLTGILIPQILLIAFRKRLFDQPDGRKLHSVLVPRLGGMAFMPSIFFAIAFVIGFELLTATNTVATLNIGGITQLCFIACAMLLTFLAGLADDLVGLRYRVKFIIQAVTAGFLIAGGLWLKNLHGFLWLNQLWPVAGVLLTILLIVFIDNAINFIDGIDGLASGLGAIALLFYGIAFYFTGEYFYAMLSAATLGTLVPFFYFNVFGDPTRHRKIFMGDTGSLTIGIILSALSLKMANMGTQIDGLQVNPVVVAFSPLVIPCFDVVRVLLHRVHKRCNPFLPDKSHIHHKLLALGVPQHVTMMVILIVSASVISINVVLSPHINSTWILLGDLVVWVTGNIILNRAIRARQQQLGIYNTATISTDNGGGYNEMIDRQLV